MNRIEKKFRDVHAAGRKAFVGYLTAGDPDPERSESDIRAAVKAGVDVLELGVPFSDPTADGPVIQEAAQRALAAGMTVRKCLDLVARLRRDLDVPIVLFGYANPFYSYGYERLCTDAARAGADGLLVVDLPFEEAAELRTPAAEVGLCLIPLIAPTTPPDRASQVLAEASGFVYYIMVTGVTGARAQVAANVAEHVRQLRNCTRLPIAAGFGVSSGAQAREAAVECDGIVVGSALVRAARENRLAGLAGEIRSALDAP
jgi:tryptophan synthase alpha chain